MRSSLLELTLPDVGDINIIGRSKGVKFVIGEHRILGQLLITTSACI